MDGIIALVVLLIVVVPIIRWVIWKDRYRHLRDAIASIEKSQKDFSSRLSALEERIVGVPGAVGKALGVAKAEAEQEAIELKQRAVAKEAAPPSAVVTSPPVAPPTAEPVPKAEEVEPIEVRRALSAMQRRVPRAEKAKPLEVDTAVEVPPKAVKEGPAERPPEAAPADVVAAALERYEAVTEPELRRKRTAAPPTEKAARRPSPMAVAAKRAFLSLIKGKGEGAVDWEALIGGRWLNIVGIVLLVIGIVLLSQQTLLYLDALGKVAVGVATSVALVLFGLLLQRVKGYRLLAWTLIGGGWALLYFTAYAAHNIEQTRIIDDPAIALAFLCIVAAGIIAHSFTYRSQLLTGLAYALGFLAVTMSPVTMFSLVASALLAASMILVIRLMPWHHLALLGVLGTYLNHWRWISGITAIGSEPSAQAPALLSGVTTDQAFWLSTGILAFYWVLFVAVSLSRRAQTKSDQIVHIGLSVANTIGFLSLSAWQLWEYQGGYLHYLVAPAAIAYFVVAYLDRAFGQRNLFLLNVSIAVVLFAITPELAVRDLGFSRDWFAAYWAAGAGLILLAGYYIRELPVRMEAYLVCLLVIGGALIFNLSGPLADRPRLLWLVVPLIIVFFQLISEWLQRMAGRRDILPGAVPLGGAFGFAATLLLARFLWSVVEIRLIGLAWLAAALISFEWGAARSRPFLRAQGYALAAIAAIALFAYNLTADPGALVSPAIRATTGALALERLPNWSIVLIGAAGLYYLYGRLLFARWTRHPVETEWISLPSFAATVLVGGIAYRELNLTLLAVPWMAWGLVLFETGKFVRQPLLRLQGYVLGAFAFVAAAVVNIYELPVEELTYDVPRWAIVGFVIIGLYYFFYDLWAKRKAAPQTEAWMGEGASYAATLLVALLLWKELPSVAVAVAWSFLGLVLFEFAAWRDLPGIRQQAHLLLLAVFARLFMANFVAEGEAFGISHRVVTVIPVIATIYYLRLRVLELLPARAEYQRSWLTITESEQTARLYSYAAAILIVVLARFELGRAYAVVAWSAFALGFLILGQRLGNIDYRFQSYLITILTFARCWSTNAYLIGSFYGFPERLATTLPAALVFFAAAFLCARPPTLDLRELRGGLKNILLWFDGHARLLYSALASLLVSILIYYQLSIDLVSIGWAIQGFALLILGFVIKDRPFRLYGLALLFICLLKVMLIDLEGVETIYRILSFILLGLILLLASLAYTRYRTVLGRYI